MIPVYQPYLPKESFKYVYEALDSGWISSLGKYKNIASAKLSKLLNIDNVLLLSNGTVATHLIIKALRYKHPHITRIIVPNNVYVAVWNSIFFDCEKCFEICPLDADINTWNANYEDAEKYYTIDENTAFLVAHNLGNIVNVPQLKRKYKNSVFIEDNCEGIFGTYEGFASGTQSFCSSLSFFGNKNITCGEGGAFICDDNETFEYIKHIHSQAQTEKKFIHDEVGYNYRMTNIHAAILLGQLEIYDEVRMMKKNIFDCYVKHLSNYDRICFQTCEKNIMHSNWMFGIRIKDLQNYEYINKFMLTKGIETRPMFYPIDEHKHLKQIPCENLNVARMLNRECVILPSYPKLQSTEIEYICNNIIKFIVSNKI